MSKRTRVKKKHTVSVAWRTGSVVRKERRKHKEGRAWKENEKESGRTSPAPACVLEHGGGDVRANEGVDDERCGREAVHEASPFEGRDVRDDDGREELQAAAKVDLKCQYSVLWFWCTEGVRRTCIRCRRNTKRE